ncbi:steroid 17-alpha-hydroxylase 17,20 lyase-like [Paramuricea clavata]|uniref:Steroid 17-alpha-hydroxylase 17,20 lyase-like n=1 Tax=Paramuricea clavata TaxID=317549 RepID=A0A6S7FR85_PARCT|nr:steroid 17-alpha-hydroxylase 17,20 lyase-like [Paramuricea clavata]
MMIVEVATTFCLVWFVWYLVTTYFERRLMPPGPFPYPLIGNLQHLNSNSSKPFRKLRETYGDIFSVTLGGTSVIVNTASLAREVRLGRNKDYAVNVLSESVYPFNIILGPNDVIFASYGTPYLFRKRVFKSAMHVFGAGINDAEERGGHAVKSMLEKIDSMKGQPFSPKELIESAILIQLWQWLTSEKVSFEHTNIKLLLEFSEIIAKQNVEGTYFHKLPFHSYLPTEFNRSIKRATDIKSSIMPQTFQSHLETYTPGVIRDMIDSFISAYKKETAKETSKDIGSIDDIRDMMIDVTFAGSDTTSSTLAWFILYMVSYPEVQKKIHDELDQVIGKDDLPRWQDVKNMPYLQATICEVMRKSSPVPITGSNTIRAITVAGYRIPKGTSVVLNLTQIHQDEQEWPEPEEFKPERFRDVEGKFVGWTKLDAFLPFGLGRRECAGIAFAKIMLFTFAATLLHRLRFELPEGAEKPNEEPSSITFVSSPGDFKVVARNRR